MSLARCYMSKEAKKAAKKKAAELDVNLIEVFDISFLGSTKKERKKNGGFNFGF